MVTQWFVSLRPVISVYLPPSKGFVVLPPGWSTKMRHFLAPCIAADPWKSGELARTLYTGRINREGWTIGWTSTVYTIAYVDQLSSASRVHRLPARGASGPGSKPHLSLADDCHFLYSSQRARDHDPFDRGGCIEDRSQDLFPIFLSFFK